YFSGCQAKACPKSGVQSRTYFDTLDGGLISVLGHGDHVKVGRQSRESVRSDPCGITMAVQRDLCSGNLGSHSEIAATTHRTSIRLRPALGNRGWGRLILRRG